MATSAQILANRRNAQLSTGPSTPEGKAASSANATRHGLAGTRFALLPNEDPEEFSRLLASIKAEFRPAGGHETFLVEQMANARWRLSRIERLEAEAFERILTEPRDREDSPDGRILDVLASNGNILEKLQRYAAAAERSYYKAHRELVQGRGQKLRNEAKSLDASIVAYINAGLPESSLQNEAKSRRERRHPSFPKRSSGPSNLALRL